MTRLRAAKLVGGWACLILLLLPVVSAVNWRVRSFVLARRIQTVLSGLEQVRLDETTEELLLKTVPGLIRSDSDQRDGSSVVRGYRVLVSNEGEWSWWSWNAPLQSFGPSGGAEHYLKDTDGLDYSLKIAYWLGWRYISFGATVSVRDGIASSISYELGQDVQLGMPRFPVLSVRSFHAIQRWDPISSTDDESPEYRIKGTSRALWLRYAADASHELSAHAFQLSLRCYYLSVSGCAAGDLAPLVWQDKQAIEDRVTLRSRDGTTSCSDRVLAGRVRYLPVNVELLEVVQPGRDSLFTTYKVKEVIRGDSWEEVVARSSFAPPRPVPTPSLQPGETVLSFTGPNFDTCQVVPATPSAEAAVRAAVPAPRRREDDRRFIENLL